VQREIDFCRSLVPGRKENHPSLEQFQPCIRRKIEQIVAKEFGVIADPSYQASFAEWKKENERRKKVKAEGGIIYGPVQYTEDGYYDYRFSMMVLKVKEKLGEKYTLTEQVLRQEYTKNKQRFKRRDSVDVEIITADDSLPGVRTNLDVNGRISKWMEENKAQRSVIHVDDASRSLYSEDDSQLLAFADTAREGAVSTWLKKGQGWRLLICRSRKDAGCVPFEEVQGILRTKLIDRKYEEMIAARLKKASVRFKL